MSDLDFESGFSYDSLDHQLTSPPNPQYEKTADDPTHTARTVVTCHANLCQTKSSPERKRPKERLLEIIHSGALSGCEWLRCHVMDAEGRLSVRSVEAETREGHQGDLSDFFFEIFGAK